MKNAFVFLHAIENGDFMLFHILYIENDFYTTHTYSLNLIYYSIYLGIGLMNKEQARSLTSRVYISVGKTI